jgi:hypothetical protein
LQKFKKSKPLKMKRILALSITMAAMIATMIACSKSNKEETYVDPLKITNESIAGKWTIYQVIKPDGSIVPYNGHCSSKKDGCEIFSYFKINTFLNMPDCQNINNNTYSCTDFVLDLSTNRLKYCTELYSGFLKLVDANTLRIDYETEVLSAISEINHSKGIVLKRQ